MNKSEKYGLLFRACGCLFLIPLDDILFIEGLSSASPDNGIYHCRGEIVTPLSLEKLLKLEKRENEKIFIVVRNNFGITAKEVLVLFTASIFLLQHHITTYGSICQ